MSEKDNGGPAFPITYENGFTDKGMTLRDWFAGQALAGFRSNPSLDQNAEDLHFVCYRDADAMLAERAKA